VVDLSAVSLIELADSIISAPFVGPKDAFVQSNSFAVVVQSCLAARNCSLFLVTTGKLIGRILEASVSSPLFQTVVYTNQVGA
jgi:hypothetical protein